MGSFFMKRKYKKLVKQECEVRRLMLKASRPISIEELAVKYQGDVPRHLLSETQYNGENFLEYLEALKIFLMEVKEYNLKCDDKVLSLKYEVDYESFNFTKKVTDI